MIKKIATLHWAYFMLEMVASIAVLTSILSFTESKSCNK